MRTGIFLSYAGGFREAVEQVVELEKVGVDIALVAEAYSFDAISQLGYLAAKTSTIELGSGVVPIYTRTPTLLAMTAAGAGLRLRRPLPARHRHLRPAGDGGLPRCAVRRTAGPHPRGRRDLPSGVAPRTGAATTASTTRSRCPPTAAPAWASRCKLINHPVRERIPITIAALGPKNVELTAEIAEGWQPVFFYPEKADEVWGDALRAGKAKRDPELGTARRHGRRASLAIGDDVDDRLAWAKPQLALYIGGMGARGQNFYHNLATRYGFGEVADHIQDLYLAGKKAEAIAAVPDELVRQVSLIGPRGFVKERIAAFAEAGVTTLLATPVTADGAEYVSYVEELQQLLP